MLNLRLVTALAAAVLGVLARPPAVPSAQRGPQHLNPAIEKLASGKPMYGMLTDDLSMLNAREIARVNKELVYIDMEHMPMNFETLAIFVAAMNDKAHTVKTGSAQPNSALVARFAPPGREKVGWVVKQALDIGLMGIIFNTIETKDQALWAVQNMRYPPQKSAPPKGPIGIRGWGPTAAAFAWGITNDEYRRRADVWPLNPDGDLLAIMAIESGEAVKNIDEIASVPGVSILHAGGGGDLSSSLGVSRDAPEMEAAFQKILKACLDHNVVCSIAEGRPEVVERRLKEGWRAIMATPGDANYRSAFR